MKNQILLRSYCQVFLFLVLFSAITGPFCLSPAHAGLTVDIHTYRSPGSYVTYGWLRTNTTPPAAPLGDYLISSPNGSQLQYQYDANGLNYITGGGVGTTDFDSYMNALTNGQWSIQVTNAISTNTYYFTVSATGLNADLFNPATITSPANNAQNISGDPTFTWTGGPIGWLGTVEPSVHDPDYIFYDSASLAPAATSWNTLNPPLPLGTNIFHVVYLSNATASIIASIPLDVGSNPISGWVSTANLDVNSDDVEFVVGGSTNAFDAYLVARYDFEDPNAPAHDSSGNGNDPNCSSDNGGTNIDTFSTDSVIGTYARHYLGDTAICFSPGASSFDNVSNALQGSFSLSAWVKTTNSVNDDFANAYFGAPILFDYNANTNSAIFSITGSKAAFTIGNNNGTDTVLHSTTSVNDGNYHFVVVTRNAANGSMNLYVDGAVEATDASTSDPVVLNTTMFLAGGYNGFFNGLLDDVRIYATELTANDVAVLAGTPVSHPLADALDTTNLVWTIGGDVGWFAQTTNTHDTVDAAQSGAIGDNQSSWIETTVTGPGTLSFWWNVDSDNSLGYDYLEFTVDGNYENDIAGSWGWDSYSINLSAGSHTLRWTYYKDASDAAGADAGFLEEVSFVPDTPPIITFQPIDQTNYPGYTATLVADATAIPEANWQWYKVGPGLIPGASSRFYTITNSGTPSVEGSYYAIASNPAGAANTRTAVVTFVSAALPPDWTKAFQTQLTGNFDNPRTNYGLASLMDADGNVYSANSFSGTNYFTTNMFVSGPGQFASGLFKHSASGAGLWGRAITNDGSGNSYPQCLARAPGDGVYLSGVFRGTNHIGTNALLETAGGSLYLARFDSTGNVLWVRTFGGTNAQFQSYHQLISDPAGNVTLSALGNNFVDFGTTNIVLEGQKGVLAQYDADGNFRWIAQPSGWVNYMAYDAGRIYAVLGGSETNYIGGVTNTSDRKYVLAALNATNGQAYWLRGIGSLAGEGNPLGVADDWPAISVSGSDVFLTGTAWGSNAVFGAFTVSWLAANSQYFARYDTNGTAQLAFSFGGPNTWPWAAVADVSGNVYVAGDFDGYSTFGNKIIGGPRLGGIGEAFRGQMFVAKFDRNGNSLWVRQAQSETPGSFVNVRDINLAADGVWVCGFVNDYANFGTNRVYGPETVVGFPFGYLYYWTGGYLAKVTESGVIAPALPVTLLNPQTPGSTFQFQFLSQIGKTNTVQSRTNLSVGVWMDRTNLLGDGTTKTVALPVSSAPTEFFRVATH